MDKDKENEKETTDEFPDLGEIFETYFGNAKKNKNIITTYKITKQQAKQGLTKDLKISVADICDIYKGREKDCQCKECKGRGYVYKEKTIELKIPPKIKNNDLIIFEKQGNKFSIDEERGDLYIKIHIYGDRSKREGKKIYG